MCSTGMRKHLKANKGGLVTKRGKERGVETEKERDRIERDPCNLGNMKETKNNRETNRNNLCEIEQTTKHDVMNKRAHAENEAKFVHKLEGLHLAADVIQEVCKGKNNKT